MNKYERLKSELKEKGTGKMKCFGNSMMPIIKSGSVLTFIKQDSYEIGDIVFCKVRGRVIDGHLIVKKKGEEYLIANNHGHENGWTKIIYGKAVSAEYANNTKQL